MPPNRPFPNFCIFKVLDELESKTVINNGNKESSDNEKDKETDEESQITTTTTTNTNTAISKADQREIDKVLRDNKRKRYFIYILYLFK